MKKVLLLLLIILCFSCKNETPNIENETPQQDNGWFLYQHKLHSLVPLESYDTACRIMLMPAANHRPISVITIWEQEQHNIVHIKSINDLNGNFHSAGTRVLRSEFNLKEIRNCFYSSKENNDKNILGEAMVERTFNDNYARHTYNFEESKTCVVSTYKFMKSVFPE